MHLFIKVVRLIRALSVLFNPRTWGPFTDAALSTRFNHSFTVSWSQCAEDLVVNQTLGSITHGRYLDIGAHHPSRFSVTRLLNDRGWNGVNVDANQELLMQFQVERPNDVNICCAVGREDSYDFTIFQESALSTVDPAWKERFLLEENKVKTQVRIQGRTLRSILDEHFEEVGPELLNIDIEGADFEALLSGDFDSLTPQRRPLLVVIENPNPKDRNDSGEIGSLLISLKYQILYKLPYSQIYINTLRNLE